MEGEGRRFADHPEPLIDPDREWRVDKNESFSRSRNNPFDGWELKGRATRTILVATRAS